MCKCNGKGYAVQTVTSGVFCFTPCDCERVERTKQELDQEMADLRKRICEAKKLLEVEVS
jgi:hypothetical protein